MIIIFAILFLWGVCTSSAGLGALTSSIFSHITNEDTQILFSQHAKQAFSSCPLDCDQSRKQNLACCYAQARMLEKDAYILFPLPGSKHGYLYCGSLSPLPRIFSLVFLQLFLPFIR
jgi:hypothetical protein